MEIKRINDLEHDGDYMTLDPSGGILGIDMFNADEYKDDEINLAVLLDKEQTEELIEYLQSIVNELK